MPISSTQRICQINDLVKNLMGAMLMKIVILSTENESHMAKKFSILKTLITKWQYFFRWQQLMEDVSEKIRGRCIRKWRFSKKKTAFAGYKIFRPFNFPTFHFSDIFYGGDASENGDFQRRKQRLQGYKIFPSFHFYIFCLNFEIFYGGDASENGDFQRKKQRLQGTKIFRAFIFIFFV